MRELTAIEERILAAAAEDYTGLWELLWDLNSSTIRPPLEHSRPLVQDALRGLVRDGLVALYEGRRFTGDERVMPDDQLETIMATDANWRPPSAGLSHIRVAASPAGEQRAGI